MKRSSTLTWDQLRVGLVILFSVLIIAVAIYKLGEAANLFSKRYELIAYLPDANGLKEGGSVMVAGQLAGVVKKIDFLPVDADTTRKDYCLLDFALNRTEVDAMQGTTFRQQLRASRANP